MSRHPTAELPIGVLVVDRDDERGLALSHRLEAGLDDAVVDRVHDVVEVHRALRTDEYDIILLVVGPGAVRLGTVVDLVRTVPLPVLVLATPSHADEASQLPPEISVHVLVDDEPPSLLARRVVRLVARAHADERHTLRLRAAEQLLASAAHELRTPLTAITGFVETLIERGEELTPTQHVSALDAIRRNAQRARRLADVVAGGTRPETVAPLLGEPHPRSLDLHAVVTAAVEDLGGRGRDITVDVPEGSHAVADADHVTEIVQNLLDNALKYGAAPIRITADAAETATITIEDAGAGVPADFAPRLFEMFSRADEQWGHRPGTGVGLALCRRLARAQGGDLRHVPTPTGARFVLELPTHGPAATAAPAAAPTADPMPAAEPAGAEPASSTTRRVASGPRRDPSRAPEARPQVRDVRVTRHGLDAVARAELAVEDLIKDGAVSVAATEDAALRGVVRATLRALEGLLGSRGRLDLEALEVVERASRSRITVTIALVTEAGVETLVGAALIDRDRERAALLATLDACNRRMARLLEA